ncbi:MAG: beta-lactamase family protein [Akkermansiaceae bacterium]|nr:beta-lactamase family protein [Akkermansiaceae bacterium]
MKIQRTFSVTMITALVVLLAPHGHLLADDDRPERDERYRSDRHHPHDDDDDDNKKKGPRDKKGPKGKKDRDPHGGRLGFCVRGDRGRLCSKCAKALVRRLEDVPAFQDGRLGTEELLINAVRNRFTAAPAFPPAGLDPNEIVSRDHLDEDGRTLRFLSREDLAELARGEGFAVRPIHFDPVLGPSELQNWPPVPPPDGFPIPGPGLLPPPPPPDNLNIGEFLDDIHTQLSPNVNGYALRIRRDGQTVGVLQWNWARNPNLGDLPGLGWNSDRRMHVASISKFMTAIGLVHLLQNTGGLDADDAILPWLPAYWNPNVGSNASITFDHLMDHRSGFSTGGSSSNWQTMKSNVKAGSPGVGGADYENMNFGLIRILISTIGGYINPNTSFGPEFINDILWDVVTQNAYNDYMQTYVFNPVGAFPVLDTNALTALAYRFDGTGPGWNSGDLAASCGGFGWHMTINEILGVVRALRMGQLVDFPDYTELWNRSWGLNSPLNGELITDFGVLYYKAGKWTSGSNPLTARTEQCFVLFAPIKQIEVAVFVNSNVTAADISLTNVVRTAFINNIE